MTCVVITVKMHVIFFRSKDYSHIVRSSSPVNISTIEDHIILDMLGNQD